MGSPAHFLIHLVVDHAVRAPYYCVRSSKRFVEELLLVVYSPNVFHVPEPASTAQGRGTPAETTEFTYEEDSNAQSASSTTAIDSFPARALPSCQERSLVQTRQSRPGRNVAANREAGLGWFRRPLLSLSGPVGGFVSRTFDERTIGICRIRSPGLSRTLPGVTRRGGGGQLIGAHRATDGRGEFEGPEN